MKKEGTGRVIKFRAWDLRSGEWRDIRYVEFWEGGYRVALWDGLNVDVRENAEDLELLQFTGLHDKNGKEIYEGDILRSGEFSYEVYWYERGAWALKGTGRTGHTNYYYSWKPSGCEVIGNIYENP